MPIECTLLDGQPCSLDDCPKCGKPFRPFLRGEVQKSIDLFNPEWWKWLVGRPNNWRYCALICWECKEIVGHE